MDRATALQELTKPGAPFELEDREIRGATQRVFRKSPPTLRELFGQARSAKPFISFDDETLTFEDAWRRSAQLAWRLYDAHGVRVGDRVAISMRNYPEWMIAFQAATSIGAIAVALNSLWPPDEMARGLTDSGAKVLVADPERVRRLLGAQSPPRDVALLIARPDEAPPRGVVSLDEAVRGYPQDRLPPGRPEPDDDAMILYTSGSSGAPKGVVSTHRAVISTLLSWELDAAAAGLMAPAGPPPPDRLVALLGVPLFHVTGLQAGFLGSLRAQRRVISMYKWDAEAAAALIERERVTHFTAPAAMTGDLLAVARSGRFDLGSLLAVGGGGSARAPEQVAGLNEALATAQPLTGWGMTETNAAGAGISGQAYVERPLSCGQCSAVMEMRIVDEGGAVAQPGERGELQVRGTPLMREYWRRPDANAEAFDGGWFRTGDVAYLDAEGFLYIVDRLKELVNRGGEKISCGLIEAELAACAGVREAAVFGVPNARLGEEVAAAVYASDAIVPADLIQAVSKRLAPHEVPVRLMVLDEPLPRTESGKILRRAVRDRCLAVWSAEA